MRKHRKLKITVCLTLICLILLTVMMTPNRPFYNEPENSVDVLFVGTSLSYNTFDPAVFDEYGISSYNLGLQQQPLMLTYYRLKDALKYQTPKVIVYESGNADFTEEKADDLDVGIADESLDQLKFSADKVKAMFGSLHADRLIEFIIPVIRWHVDLDKIGNFLHWGERDPYRGYFYRTDVEPTFDIDETEINDDVIKEVPDYNMKYILAMKDLADEVGAKFVIVKAPFGKSDMGTSQNETMNALTKWGEENDVPTVNMTRLWREIGFQYDQDFADKMHMNVYGAIKASVYTAEWLQDLYPELFPEVSEE